MKEKLKILRWLPGLVISIIAIIFIIRIVDFEILAQSMKDIGIINIAIISGITVVSLMARAVAWMRLLPKVKFLDSFLLINEAYLFNNLIPRSGELVKTFLFAKPSKENAYKIISSVIVERSLDLVIAASMFLITFPFISRLDNIHPIAILLLVMFVLFLISAFLIAVNAEKVKVWLRKIGKKNSGFIEKILPKIEMIIDGFQVLTNWRQIISVFLWISISWMLWTFLLFFGLKAIFGDAKFWWAIFTEGVLALGIALPSAPAGLGVYEGTMIAALSVFDISAEISLGLAVVIHLIQIGITSIIGFIAVLKQGESIPVILQRIKSSQKNKINGQQN
ncbi:MAG: lysylphosphatidylglycerol synthase transmembrane domain-containing protein [Pelolinea sp.]|nr:lysylphosphatidylglycerol synthase transmembrane domain-containing protein [Pelolinea sp.]